MPLDSLYVRGLAEELHDRLSGGRIEKIYMPYRDKIYMTVGRSNGGGRLLLCGGSDARVHLTKDVPENPASPPVMCMFLRKHIGGGRILSVSAPEWERIIRFVISVPDEMGDFKEKTLVCEMTGRMTNIILHDSDGIILNCLKHVDYDMSDRAVLPGLKYHMPPQQKKQLLFLMTDAEILSVAEQGHDFDFLMSRIGGIPPLVMRSCMGDTSGATAAALISVRDAAPSPYMLVSGKEYTDFSSVHCSDSCVRWSSFSELLDDYFMERSRKSVLKNSGQNIIRTMQNAEKRLIKKLAEQRQELLSAQDREKVKERADLIMANLHSIKPGERRVTLTNYFREDMPNVTLDIDPLLSPQDNGARLYKKYARLKNAETALAQQIKQGEEELSYVQNVLYNVSQAESIKELTGIRRELEDAGYLKTTEKKKKEPTFTPRIYDLGEGYEALCGRNNIENDRLTYKTAAKTDLWFHARNIPGSHVILRTGGATPPPHIIEKAASVAALHSSGDGKTAVDYTLAKNVKKPPGAKPGMVNYYNHSTIITEPYKAE